MLPEDDLRWLIGSRWFVPLLALASREEGVRSAALVGPPRASRAPCWPECSMQLLGKGWLMRNPGHGHPLRPEYVLTEAGPAGRRLVRAGDGGAAAARASTGAGLGRWSLPAGRPARPALGALLLARGPAQPDQPALAVAGPQAIAGGRLVERRLEDAFPPRPLYGLTGRGQRLARAMR